MIEKHINDAETLSQIRELMGYVQNGSARSVTLFQDEATMSYHVRLERHNQTYWGTSLREAVAKDHKDNPTE